MASKRGSLSINSDNIFPIIKKWLYSDHDIFFRELISNGCDAITKLKKLEVMGEYTFPENHKNQIQVIVNPEEKTLKFIDTGLGMTADEVEEYITQIAFSGATQFLEKYKDKTNEDQIIGHFGLGFYSAFMVADVVEIDTLSYREGAQAVHWSCDGGTEYELEDSNRTEVGTEITLHLNEESLEFANEYRAREVIEKYCSFMPVEIYLSKANAPQEYETIDEADLREDDVVVEHIHEDAKTEEKETTETDRELPSNLIRMFTCADLDAIILAAEALHGFYQGKNTLYKDPQEHTYHLIVHQSQHTISEFNRVINLICSYLKPQKYTAGLQAFYEEHFQKIIRGNALQQLGKIT